MPEAADKKKKGANADITLPTKVHLVKAMVFPVRCENCTRYMDERIALERKLCAEELMLSNCDVREDF